MGYSGWGDGEGMRDDSTAYRTRRDIVKSAKPEGDRPYNDVLAAIRGVWIIRGGSSGGSNGRGCECGRRSFYSQEEEEEE